MSAGAGFALALAAAPWGMPPPSADPLGDIERAAAAARLFGSDEESADQEMRCDQVGDDAIVVCGRRERVQRMAFPPIPGQRRRLIAGEPPSAATALAGGGCIQRCEGSVGISLDPVELLRDPVAALKRAFHIAR